MDISRNGQMQPLTNFWQPLTVVVLCMTLCILATSTWKGCGLHISMIILFNNIYCVWNGAAFVNSLKWCVSFETAGLTVWFKCTSSLKSNFSMDINIYLTTPQVLINQVGHSTHCYHTILYYIWWCNEMAPTCVLILRCWPMTFSTLATPV